MKSFGRFSAGLLLPLVVATCIVAAPERVAAQRAPEATGAPHVIGGWSGSGPDPLAVAGDESGQVSAVFTTSDDSSTTVWQSRGDQRGTWQPARALATDVVAGSPAFAMNRRGASVLAWSVEDGAATRRLLASTSDDVDGPWSTPIELARDVEGFDQMPSVDLARNGLALIGYRHDTGAGPMPVTRLRRDGQWADQFVREVPPGVTQLRVSMSGAGFAGFAYDFPNTDPQPEPQDASHFMRLDRYAHDTDRWRLDPNRASIIPDVGIDDLTMAQDATHIVSWLSRDHYRGGFNSTIYHTYRFSLDAECDEVWDCLRTYTGGGHYEDLPLTSLAEGQVHKTPTGMGISVHLGPTDVGVSESNLTFWNGGWTNWEQERPNDGLRSAIEDYQMAVAWLHHTEAGVEQRLRTLQVGGSGGPLPNRGYIVLGAASGPGEVTLTPSGHTVMVWPDSDGTLRSHDLEPSTHVRVVVEEYQASDEALVRWAGKKSPRATRYDVRYRQGTPRRALGDFEIWKRRTPATRAVYQSRPGRTVCFSSRSQRNGDRSAWSRQRCTAIPADDTAARRSRAWREVESTSAYGGGRVTARQPGATLTVPDVAGHSLALLVEVGGTGGRGRFRVSWGGHDIGVFDTEAPGQAKQILMPLATFREPVQGDVVIETLDDERVVVDGIHVNRAR